VSNTWIDLLVATVTVLTFVFLVVWRIRDSQTRTETRVEVVTSPCEKPKLVFQVVNRSKMTIHLNGQAHLIEEDEDRSLVSIDRANDTGLSQQGSFMTYVIQLALVRMKLHDQGYRNKTTAFLYFAVHDATGKLHELPVIVQNLNDSNTTTVVALPFPWYKRWYRRIRRRLRQRISESR